MPQFQLLQTFSLFAGEGSSPSVGTQRGTYTSPWEVFVDQYLVTCSAFNVNQRGWNSRREKLPLIAPPVSPCKRLWNIIHSAAVDWPLAASFRIANLLSPVRKHFLYKVLFGFFLQQGADQSHWVKVVLLTKLWKVLLRGLWPLCR